MSFSTLMGKLANGQTLTAAERDEVVLEASRLEEVAALVTSLIQPGTRVLRIEGLVAENAEIRNASFDGITVANEDVTIDGLGVYFKNQEGEIGFENAAGTDPNSARIAIDGFDQLTFKNLNPEGLRFEVDSTDGWPMQVVIKEDAAVPEKLQVNIAEDSEQGAKLSFGMYASLNAQGTVDGANFLQLYQSANPDTPMQNNSGHIYVRNSKLVIQWNESGTVRYKYLDLTGTGVTWTHTTTPP